jgi:hypothetical protein
MFKKQMFIYNLEFRCSILNRVTNFFVLETVQTDSPTRKPFTNENQGGGGEFPWSKETEARNLTPTLSYVANIDTGAPILFVLFLDHKRCKYV